MAIGAGPRGCYLHDGATTYARVSALGSNWRGPLKGWYWVASVDGIPYVNTFNQPVATEQEAKDAAMAYIKSHLNIP